MDSTHGTQVLVIALDSMDVDLLREWISAGKLPHLKAFADTTFFQTVQNQPGIFAGSAWSTIGTGLDAGEIGRYYSKQLEPGGYGTRPFRAQDLGHPPFWRDLSDAGKRVAIINFPKFPAEASLNGVQLTNWGVSDVDGEYCSFPPSFAAEVVEKYGTLPNGVVEPMLASGQGVDRAVEVLRHSITQKLALSRDLLAQGGWDLVLTTFSEAHCAGHFFWQVHDADYPVQEATRVEGDPVLEIYQRLDDAIGTLIGEVGPETPVFLVSSHGMGPFCGANHMLDDLLARLTQAEEALTPLAGTGGVKRLAPRASGWARQALKPLVAKIANDRQRADRRNRRCFAMPSNSYHGSVRINLIGREPNGLVAPGAAYQALEDDLVEGLGEVINTDTGKPIAGSIWRIRDILSGSRIDMFPDIVIEWQGQGPVERVHSPRIGELAKPLTGWRKWGDHRNPGFLMTRAPDISPGIAEEPISVLELAPTLVARLGVSLNTRSEHARAAG